MAITEFAGFVRGGRLLRGYTIPQLADATGVPSWRIKAFEAGDSIPWVDEFSILWDVLSTEEPRGTRGGAR